MRLFIALELSDEIRRALGGLIAGLQRHRAPVKWVEQKNIHLTLKFLGETPAEKLEPITDAMRRCVEPVPPFRIELKNAGGFPNLHHPRVIFADLQDTPPTIVALAEKLEQEMVKLGFAREERPFTSHVTIGRIKAPGPISAMTTELEKLATKSFGAMTVEQIVLMKSDLTPTGPIYTPVSQASCLGNVS